MRYVLEGSAQHGGSKVRVTAQLIDAATGAHLWVDQFDADQSDLLEMQDEIVTRLSRALAIQLVAADVVRVSRTRPDNLNAQDLAMRCSAGMTGMTEPTEWAAAANLCERALQIDGSNVLALGLMALLEVIPSISAQSADPTEAIGRTNAPLGQLRLIRTLTLLTSPSLGFSWRKIVTKRRLSRRNIPSF